MKFIKTLEKSLSSYVLLLVLLSLLTFGQCVLAAAEPDQLILESEFFSDIPSIDTVTRLPQRRSETPAAVTIIDRDMIRASGIRTLPDLFRLIPGFQVAYSRGEIASVTYHGLGDTYSRRMLTLIDGKPSYGAFIGNVGWSNLGIAIEDIERIEVVRGPNAAAYGANAFLGTINIITRHTSQTLGTTAQIRAGTHDIKDGLLTYGTQFEGGAIRVTGNYQAEDGLEGLPDSYRTRTLNVRSDLQPTNKDSLLLQFGLSNIKPTQGTYNNPFFPAVESDVTNDFEQIRWQRQLQNDQTLSLQFFHNYGTLDYDYQTNPVTFPPPIGTIQIPISNDILDERYDLELQHSFHPLTDLRMVWGLGIREDQAVSEPLLNSSDRLTNRSSRMFGNVEWRAGVATTLNAGLMIENTQLTGTDLSPRLAINHQLNNNHTLRAAWSQAHRIPTLFEEFGDTRIMYSTIVIDQVFDNSGGLEPETMDSYELGYLGHFPAANISVDVRLYRDRLRHIIAQTLVPAADVINGTALDYRNEGSVTVDGLDLELIYQPSRDTRIAFTSAFMTAAARDFSSNSVHTAQDYEASVPDFSLSLLAMHKLSQNWLASLGYYWVDEMLWFQEIPYSNERAVGKMDRLDLRLAHQMRFNTQRGEAALVLQNLGGHDEEYSSNQYLDSRVFLTLRLDI